MTKIINKSNITIYDKINNHKLLNNTDIKNYVLQKGVIYNTNCSVKFTNNKDEYYAFYRVFDNEIVIPNDYVLSILNNEILKKEFVNFKNTKCITDLCNLYLIFSLEHELFHSVQNNLFKKSKNDYIKLLKISNDMIDDCKKLYDINHDLYLLEYNANIKAIQRILNTIDNKINNIDIHTKYLLNRIFATTILSSYGFEYPGYNYSNEYSNITSPINFIKKINTYLCKPSEYDEIINLINKVENKCDNELDRIYLGYDLYEDTINKLVDIRNGEINSLNLLKEFNPTNKTLILKK